MVSSTITLPQGKVELDRLITTNEVQYNRGLFGCCFKFFVKFPNDSHKYCYNRDKLISNKLFKKVLSHLYNMSPKPLNQKQPTITDNAVKTLQSWIKKNKDSFKQEDTTYK